MTTSAQRILFLLVLLILCIVLPIVLQIFLSRAESRWPGLVLPVITAIGSLITVFGTVYLEETSVLTAVFLPLILWNLPTLVLLAIYVACRRHRSKNAQINKMNIQDLE